MDIREKYNLLLNYDLDLSMIKAVIELKNECKLNNNYEYFYLSNLLIIDIYINENLLTDALNIAYKNFDDLDPTIYKNIYVSLLERLIYICIQKKNYQSAFRYANEKRLYIDNTNSDEVNRWYLEMAYIHDALNEKSHSLSDLIGILENNPDDSLRLIVLNNITKLYIDSKDIIKAKEYLNLSMDLAYKLNDNDGKIYCQYLNAKLYILEDKKKFAQKLFSEIFRGKQKLDDEYIGYLNEYISLLNDMQEYSETKKIGDRYLDSIENCIDLYSKKDFYKNYLKAVIFLVPSISDEVKKLYVYIGKIEEEINKTNELISTESNEDDKKSQINSKLKETVDRLEKLTNVVNYALISSNERDCLMDYSKGLEKIVPFTEATFFVFNRATFEAYPKFLDSYSKVTTFSYKKERLYEREISYNDLNDTIVEMLITANKDISIDFNDTRIPTKEVITGKTYLDLKVKYLYATPLSYGGDLYACVVYTSNISDITTTENIVSLKIASRLLESKLVNLFYQESLRTQKNILQVAMNGLQEGLYYYNVRNKKMYLSEQMHNFIQTKDRYISEFDYAEMIKDSDQKVFFGREEIMNSGNKYDIEYTINLEGNEILINEQGNPYFNKNGELGFYICTINKIVSNQTILQKEKNKYLYLSNSTSLNEKLNSLKDNTFSLFMFELNNLKQENFEKFYHLCLSITNDVYQLSKTTFACIIDETNNRVLDSHSARFIKEVEDLKIVLITYPSSYANIENMISISKMMFLNDEKYQKINENIINSYNKNLFVTNCVNEALLSKNIETLYSPLYRNDELFGYFTGYNIKGIFDNNIIYSSLSKEDIIKFQLYLYENIKEIKNKTLYFNVNLETIIWMKENMYLETNKNNKINFVIVNNNKDLSTAIKYLEELDIKYFVEYNLLNEIPINTLYSENFKGIIILDEMECNNPIFDLIIKFNKLVITDSYLENNNYIYYEGKMYKLSDIE